MHISAIGLADASEGSNLIIQSDEDESDDIYHIDLSKDFKDNINKTGNNKQVLSESKEKTPEKNLPISNGKAGVVPNKVLQEVKVESQANKLPSQNTLSCKEINDNSKSLITVKDFSESDRDDSNLVCKI